MTSVVVIDGGGNILEYVTGEEEAQQVKSMVAHFLIHFSDCLL